MAYSLTLGKGKFQTGRMVPYRSWRGHQFSVWENPAVMPRIEDKYLENPIYLYASKEDAVKGEKHGGSGFVVGILIPNSKDLFHPTVYAVTNQHVIDGGFIVIRINTYSGGYDILETKPESWIAHGEDDLAVCPIRPSVYEHDFRLIGTQDFVTEELVKKHNIGPGDEVFMVGRYVAHAGTKKNLPIVRFGNIAMNPNEPTANFLGKERTHFLVEARSVSGFSGSPVFVYDVPFNRAGVRAEPFFCYFLGIDCGHLPVYEKPLSAGIAVVIPAWRITEILWRPELIEMRNQDQIKIREQKDEARRSGIIIPE